MTLAEIIRAQLATGRPLRVTRALLEAIDAPPPSSYALAREIESLLGIGPDVPYEHRLGRGVEALRVIIAERDEARADSARLRAILDRVDDRTLDHAADAASWRDQCMDAREDALRLARERDEARLSLAERTAEREALCERVSELEDADADAVRDAASETREAEERGARWALTAIAMWSGGAWAMSVAEAGAKRICDEARKAGKHG